MKRVAIIHPWFPHYREPLFSRLHEMCAASDVELSIFHGDAPPEWAQRGDSVAGPLATHLPTKFIRVGRRSLGLKSLRHFHQEGPYDLVILEQAIRNLETYRLMASPRYRNRIAWWGHGRTYTEKKSAEEERLKSILTRRGRWFFAYTQGGAQDVVSQGFPEGKVTVLNNSIDTSSLTAALAAVDENPSQIERFKAENDLTEDTALYIGGLDASKRIEFLLEASRRVNASNPRFRLLVAGDGEMRNVVQDFALEHRWCRYVGSLFGADKALAMRSSSLIVLPGRVGLAAVDSFVAGLPIVTTDWPFHAPEFDYLTRGVTAVITVNSIAAYADGVLQLLSDVSSRNAMAKACRSAASDYGIEPMSTRFFIGIRDALEMERPRA